MASSLFVPQILSLNSNSSLIIKLAQGELSGRFDMPTNYSFDLNITSTDASGTLDVILQNDDPNTSTFTSDPSRSFIISGGTFPSGRTKISLDSWGAINTIYMNIKYTRVSGSGSIQFLGQIKYT